MASKWDKIKKEHEEQNKKTFDSYRNSRKELEDSIKKYKDDYHKDLEDVKKKLGIFESVELV